MPSVAMAALDVVRNPDHGRPAEDTAVDASVVPGTGERMRPVDHMPIEPHNRQARAVFADAIHAGRNDPDIPNPKQDPFNPHVVTVHKLTVGFLNSQHVPNDTRLPYRLSSVHTNGPIISGRSGVAGGGRPCGPQGLNVQRCAFPWSLIVQTFGQN